MLLALLATLSLGLRALPERLTLGEADRVELELRVPRGAEAAAVEWWSSVGRIEHPQKKAGGILHATWRAPRERFPQVALILATVRSGDAEARAWLALPLISAEPLTLSTKPGSRVEITVGSATFGPVRADGAGKATIRTRIPPGLRTARVRVRDPFGNVNESAFDLRPPPFRRVRLLASRSVASWSDPDPVMLEIFAVAATGQPARAAELSLSADRGSLGPVEEVGGGVFRVPFRAPGWGSGSAAVTASLPGELASEKVSIELRPGAPAEVKLRSIPAEIRGAGEARVEAVIVDGRGNELPGEVTFAAEGAELERLGPGAARLRVALAVRGSVLVRATHGAVSGVLPIPLRVGAPARALVDLASVLRRGRPAEAIVRLEDQAGNPVPGALLDVEGDGVTPAETRDLGGGRYAVHLFAGTVSRGPAGGRLRVRAGAAAAEARFTVVPDERSDGITAGLFAGGHSNFSHATAGGLTAEIAARPGLPELELLGRTALFGFSAAQTPLASPAQGQRGELRGFALTAGARASVPLGSRLSLHVALTGGALRAFGSLRVVGGPADGVRQGVGSWGPVAEAAGGASMSVSGGRLLAELKWIAAPARGDLGGNLGGPGFSVGYLYVLR